MSITVLRSTQFRVQKLRSNGSDGRAAPYQITTFRGRRLGFLGNVPALAPDAQMINGREAANGSSFELSATQRLQIALQRLGGRDN